MRFRQILPLLLLPILSFAQQIATDRPDQTESAATIPQGSFQTEAGLLLGNNESLGLTERQIVAPTLLFRYGLLKPLELRVVSQYESISHPLLGNTSGFSDLELGIKLQLFRKENVPTEIALLSHVVLPTGSPGFRNGATVGSISRLSVAHELGEAVSLGYNLGYEYSGTEPGTGIYSLALGFGITDKLSLFAEPYGEWVDFNTHLASFDAGWTYLIRDNLQFDLSIGTGLNYRMNYLSTGISWNIAEVSP